MRGRGSEMRFRTSAILQVLAIVVICAWGLRFVVESFGHMQHVSKRGGVIPRHPNWPIADNLKRLRLHQVDIEDPISYDPKRPIPDDVQDSLKELDFTAHPEEMVIAKKIELDEALIFGKKQRVQKQNFRYADARYSLEAIEERRLQRGRYAELAVDIDDLRDIGDKYNQFNDIGFVDDDESSLKAALEGRKEREKEVESDDTKKVESDDAETECHLKLKQRKSVPWISLSTLPRALTCEQYDDAIVLLKNVTNFFEDQKMNYVMVFGTLLGSAIGHDLIPWDDDLDLAVSLPHFKRMLSIARNDTDQLLSKYNLEYILNSKNQDKLFFADRELIPNATWSWPFVDVLYYDENNTHVWVHDPLEPHVRNVTAKKSAFYPLRKRPVGQLSLSSPFDPVVLINATYGPTNTHMTCKGTLQGHMTASGQGKQVTVPCSEIVDYYPLVHRTRSQSTGTVTETLKLGNQTIYSMKLQEPFHANFNPNEWSWL